MADGGLAIALFVASMIIQVSAAQSARRRQKRMQAEAAARADAAKGFAFTVEGDATALPIAYGRNKIGGIRVYHNISNTYVYAAPNGNYKAFCPYVNPDSKQNYTCDSKGNLTAVGTRPDPALNFMWPRGADRWMGYNSVTVGVDAELTYSLPSGDVAWYPRAGVTTTANLPPQPIFPVSNNVGEMMSGLPGEKREFLGLQQAICFGEINDVLHAYIDGKDWDDPTFSNSYRMVVHKAGGENDSLMVANYAERSTAKFAKAAYASGIFRLNRDDPQFSGGAPDVQFLIEGMKVYTLVGTLGYLTLSPTKVYSNNPAWCLLDYLTNADYGRGLSLSEIDLDSFYLAAQVCDIPVSTFDSTLANLNLEGEYWRRKGGTRSYKLYECNVTLSSGKSVRDNVETLLETMGMAELIWSAGKYKLSLINPIPDTSGYAYQLGDIKYLTGSDGYVQKQSDGSFKEFLIDVTDDDILRNNDINFAWPNAQSRYNLVTVRFLNEAKDFAEDTVSWPKRYSSVHTSFLTADRNVPLEVESFESGITDYYHALAKAEQKCRVSRNATNYQFSLTSAFSRLEQGDLIRVNSSVLQLSNEIIRIESVSVKEDGVVSIEGFTYSCLDLAWNAKDTEIVTPVRKYGTDIGQASNLKFMAESNTLSGSSGTLSWDASTDSNVTYYTVMYAKTSVDLIDVNTEWISLGDTTSKMMYLPALVGGVFTLTVVAKTPTRSAPFKSYYTGAGWPLLQVGIGATLVNGKYLANIAIYMRSATVPSKPVGGSYDFKTNTYLTLPTNWHSSRPTGFDPLYVSNALAEATIGNTVDTTLTWSDPILSSEEKSSIYLTNPVISIFKDVNGNYSYTYANGNMMVFDNGVNKVANSTFGVSGMVNCTVTMSASGAYAVTNMTAERGSATLLATYNGITYSRPLTVVLLTTTDVKDPTPPPNVTAVSISVGFTSIFISLPSLPSYSTGNGHDATEVYYAEGSSLFSSAKKIAEFKGTDTVISSKLNTTWNLWFKYRTKDGVLSTTPYGPVAATTGLVNGVDLNPLITESFAIADGSITTVKIADLAIEQAKIANGAVVMDKIAANAITATKIAANAILADKIAANAIEADKIAANAVTASKISAGAIAVGSAAIANGAIANAMIADAAIDSAKIANASINSAKISGTIQSDNFSLGYSGWQINKAGSIYASQLVIYDGYGGTVLSAGNFTGSIAGTGASTLLNNVTTAAGNANEAYNLATTAKNNADSALAQANTANTAVNNMSSDNVLTALEKQEAKRMYDSLSAEVSGINNQANYFGITTELTAYTTAGSNLSSYLSPLLSSLTTDSNIVGSTYRSYWSSYYSARQALLNKIDYLASTLATVNGLSGTFTQSKIDVLMPSAVIGSAQIKDAAISSAKIGNLQVQNANIANLSVGSSKIGTPTSGVAYVAPGGTIDVWHNVGRPVILVTSVIFPYANSIDTQNLYNVSAASVIVLYNTFDKVTFKNNAPGGVVANFTAAVYYWYL